MSKQSRSILLIIGAILPLVLLFWPFAWWGTGMRLVLRVVPAVCVQLLACRRGRRKSVKWIPFIATGILAFWGIWLWFTSPHWSNVAWLDVVADYISPVLGCGAALAQFIVLSLLRRTGKRDDLH